MLRGLRASGASALVSSKNWVAKQVRPFARPARPTASWHRPLDDRLVQVVAAPHTTRPRRLPVVLAREEVWAVLEAFTGVPRLACTILYGSGLRLLEALQLRVKDIDFGRGEIAIRDGKGRKDRLTALPNALHQTLEEHLRQVRQQHEVDWDWARPDHPLHSLERLVQNIPVQKQQPGHRLILRGGCNAAVCRTTRSYRPGAGWSGNNPNGGR